MRTTCFVCILCFIAISFAQPEGYAPLDGVTNNLHHPEYTSVYVDYDHLEAYDKVSYADGFGELADLPNERYISNRLFGIEGVVNPNLLLNLLHIGIGQCISHDIQTISSFNPRENEYEGEYVQIPIPRGDAFFDPYGTGNKFFTFKRTNYLKDSGTNASHPREVVDLVSPVLDLSITYGISQDVLTKLRNDTHPQYLKIGHTAIGEKSLPYNTMGVDMANQFQVPESSLYAAGHLQANQNILLALGQTLFTLEHNSLAEEIEEEHPNWSADKVFWEARKWNIAQFQAIAFNEYIPAMIGVSLDPYDGYNPDLNTNPSFIFNNAFRTPHTSINADIFVVAENREVLTSIRFRDTYYRPEVLDKLGFSNLLRGAMMARQSGADSVFVSDVRNFLFGAPGEGGIDLAALDIFRSRDFGLPFYNDAREILGLRRVDSFYEITSNPIVAATLEDIYGHPDNAESLVVALTEDRTNGGITGEYATAAIKQHMEKLRAGDRFYYENEDAGFDDEDIEVIARTTIADLIIRNSNVQQLPCGAFYVSDILDCGTPPPVEQTIALLPNTAELLDGDILLTWEIADDEINFVVEAKTSGWVGIGLATGSGGSMVGADAMIGWVDDSTAIVADYRITARAVGCDGVCPDTEQGGTDDILRVSGIQSGGVTTLAWSRKLDTGDNEDEVIDESTIPIVFAMGSSDTLGYHGGKKGAADINFFTGTVAITDVEEEQGPEDRLTVHGVLMFVAWAVIFPLGIVIVKFCRKLLPRWWFRLHMFIQYIGVLTIIVALILAVEAVADEGEEEGHIHDAHGIMGVISICLAIITPALGQATAVMYEAPKKVPLFPDRCHSFMGYFSPLVAFATIFLGLEEKHVAWWWYFLVAIWIAFVIIGYALLLIIDYIRQILTSRKNRKANMGISAEEAEDSWSDDE